MRKTALRGLALIGWLLFLPGGVRAQPCDSMDQMLDQVDRPGYWQNTPGQGNQGQARRQFQGAAQWQGAPESGFSGQSAGSGGQNGFGGQSVGGGGALSGGGLLRAFLGGSPAQTPVKPPENPFTPRNLLKAFLGGDASSTSTDPQALSNARSNLQVALDQAAQAEDAASRASWGHKDTRLSAAEEAQNHANAARAAADRATSAAYGKSMPANDAASQARDAAARAQAAADQARYNASNASD